MTGDGVTAAELAEWDQVAAKAAGQLDHAITAYRNAVRANPATRREVHQAGLVIALERWADKRAFAEMLACAIERLEAYNPGGGK